MTTVKAVIDGIDLTIETGRMARQADGAVVVRLGDTVVLVTVVANRTPSDKDFVPLFVEYREKLYAAGRIPGGFFKREGRPGEKETLAARQIDRPIRPLFPKEFMFETQIVAQVLSYDGQNQPDVLGIVGASAAFAISDIPFPEMISGVRVGKVEGKYVVNPQVQAMEQSEIDIVVAGTDSAVIMVEGGANEVTEDDMIGAVYAGHAEIKRLNALQRDLVRQAGAKTKRAIPEAMVVAELDRAIEERCTERIRKTLRIKGKMARKDALDDVVEDAQKAFAEKYPEREGYIAGKIEDIETDRDALDDPRRGCPCRRPRRDGHPRHHLRDRRSSAYARFGAVHARRNAEPGGAHARNGPGRADARHDRGGELEALHAPL